MMTSETTQSLFVFIHLSEHPAPVLAGRLDWFSDRVSFTYGTSYLARNDALALDPLRLPLTRGITHDAGLYGNLGVFGDAKPDHWGQQVLRRENNGLPISEPELLLRSSGWDRIGALEFSTSTTLRMDSPQIEDMDTLLEIATAIEQGDPLSPALTALLLQESSMGGARPKATYRDKHGLWLAKFPSRDDLVDTQIIECASLDMAQQFGIDIPRHKIAKIKDQSVLLVERFDRQSTQSMPKGVQRLHYLSASTICGVTPSQDRKSYLLFADELRRLAAPADGEQLYRRMVFNILISNTDDHVKNHGLLYDNQRTHYRLSPAFDIVAGAGGRRTQAMIVGNQGTQSTLSNAVSECARFGLKTAQAVLVINEGLALTKNWTQTLRAAGADKRLIRDYQWPILPDVVLKGWPTPF